MKPPIESAPEKSKSPPLSAAKRCARRRGVRRRRRQPPAQRRTMQCARLLFAADPPIAIVTGSSRRWMCIRCMKTPAAPRTARAWRRAKRRAPRSGRVFRRWRSAIRERGCDAACRPRKSKPCRRQIVRIAFPYCKLMVANSSVNQGAAFLVTSLAEARARGISDDRVTFVGQGAAAHEPVDLMARVSYRGLAEHGRVHPPGAGTEWLGDGGSGSRRTL